MTLSLQQHWREDGPSRPRRRPSPKQQRRPAKTTERKTA